MSNKNKFLDKLIVEKNYVVGVFDDDHVMLNALKELKEKNFVAKDAFTPFPVHGIDKVLNLKPSNIGYAAFAFGALGGLFAIWLQVYIMHYDWPMNFGGKPTLAIPSFVPITFELTVLISALGLAAVYFMRSHLIPGLEPKLYDQRQTTDRFVVVFDVAEGDRSELKKLLEEQNAENVREEIVKESKYGFPLPIKY